ncbi:Gfo/Idh/MocA family protein [Agromyces aerolatus]|uniref:Gfo/Idh/MocA family protein n=1 Tax=Agromyces sp. LY-1074 TaxID=3074080 RepID=UPI0028564F16|nr:MULTISPECIES: Gfo/Idh/MocA family oxidoreductase [unclassified Agromyces]MDR5701365.1 Gfo/Idh/MocA family oxidoreductase [Agromyces sp. LY-1074]MDR5706846.1 Gfo/Idh/MocA family oxidoreductase [Agromyces sp. LY-1358]
MSDDKLRVGVLGIGEIALGDHGVLPNLHHISDKVELVALADMAPDRLQSTAEKYGVPHVFSSLDEMLRLDGLDAVVNLTPIAAHGSTSRQILEAGKHLAVEKPVATTMADADAIVQTAQEQGLTVVVSPPNMLYPSRSEARKLLREGAVGRVAFARARPSGAGPAAGAPWRDPSWYYQKGSGPTFDVGVYGIHELLGLLGPVQRVSAFSGITDPVRSVRRGPYAGLEIEVTMDDNTLMLLDFGDSVFAVVDSSFNIYASKGPRIEVYGREGALNINYNINQSGPAPAIEIYKTDIGGAEVDGWIAPNLGHLAGAEAWALKLKRALLVDHLADSVRDGIPSALGADVARHALEIMLGAYESARTGQVVEITSTFVDVPPPATSLRNQW